jgi:hypothetical protein
LNQQLCSERRRLTSDSNSRLAQRRATALQTLSTSDDVIGSGSTNNNYEKYEEDVNFDDDDEPRLLPIDDSDEEVELDTIVDHQIVDVKQKAIVDDEEKKRTTERNDMLAQIESLRILTKQVCVVLLLCVVVKS